MLPRYGARFIAARVGTSAATRASLLLVLLTPPAAFPQQGAVTGLVRDVESDRALDGAQVHLAGSGLGSVTDGRGWYRIDGVPPGTVTVRVRLIGYQDREVTVTLREGELVNADFSLRQTALRLQDLVVTGLVAGTPRVKLPFTVERLDADRIPVPAADVTGLLAGKAPGVTVVRGSGKPGDPASILLRGPTSIDVRGRTQAPLVVIDGVIQSRNASLAEINTLDIDHIEIAKGAAAASLYGSRAQNGVIRITTRRGSGLDPGELRFRVRGEYGLSEVAGAIEIARNHPYVMNEAGTKFVTDNGREVDYHEFNRNGNGGPVLNGDGGTATAIQDGIFPGPLFDQLDRFFDPGEHRSLYSAVSGRFGKRAGAGRGAGRRAGGGGAAGGDFPVEGIGFRLSFEDFLEEGTVACAECAGDVGHDGYRRRSARLNVDASLWDRVEFSGSAFYATSFQDQIGLVTNPFNRLALASPFVDLTTPDEDGRPRVDVDPVSLVPNPLYELAVADDFDRRNRVMGSAELSWSLFDWLAVEGNASYDRTDFRRQVLRPRDERAVGGGVTGGRLRRERFFEQSVNASLTGTLRGALLDGDLVARGKVRLLGEEQEFHEVRVAGRDFVVGGVASFDALDPGTLNVENLDTHVRALGYFFTGGLDYRGRYIVDGLARRDGSSLFGPRRRWHWYYRISAAWRPSQEPWWPWKETLEELKLRYSYGTAGGRPDFFSRFETFGVTGGQIVPTNLGNRALRPEHTVEQEAGLSLVIRGRIGLEVTRAWARTDRQILEVPNPAFLGFAAQWQNAGALSSDTWEGSLQWAALEGRDARLSFRLAVDRTRHRIRRLDFPPFTRFVFQFAEGEELGSIWGRRWARECGDVAPMGISAAQCRAAFQVNDDGYLVWVGEGNAFTDGIARGLWGTSGQAAGHRMGWGLPVKVLDRSRVCLRRRADPERCPLTDLLPIGSATPDFNGSFGTSLAWRSLSLYALLDAAVGHEIDNFTRQAPFRDGLGGEVDQAGKPQGLKKPLLYYQILLDGGAPNTHFIEEGSWLKLRELSVGYSLPRSLLRSAFGDAVDRVTVSLIGRNLLTVTGYRGYDPEVGFSGRTLGHAGLQRVDSFQYPNFRTVTASLEVTF